MPPAWMFPDFGLLKQMRDPEVRRGLAITMARSSDLAAGAAKLLEIAIPMKGPFPMTTKELSVVLDVEGFMTDPKQWTPEIAEAFAEEEGIAPLTDRHWLVINFVRSEAEKTGEFPTLRSISKRSGVETKELYELFPKGPAKKIARCAGYPKPKGCI